MVVLAAVEPVRSAGEGQAVRQDRQLVLLGGFVQVGPLELDAQQVVGAQPLLRERAAVDLDGQRLHIAVLQCERLVEQHLALGRRRHMERSLQVARPLRVSAVEPELLGLLVGRLEPGLGSGLGLGVGVG